MNDTYIDMKKFKKTPNFQLHQSTCKASDETRFHAGDKPLLIINPHVFAAIKKDEVIRSMISSQSPRQGFHDFTRYLIHTNTLLEGKYSYAIVNNAVSSQFFKMVESGVDHDVLQLWTDKMIEKGELITFTLEV